MAEGAFHAHPDWAKAYGSPEDLARSIQAQVDASEDALVARILRKRPELAEALEGRSREVRNFVALEWERHDNDPRWAGY